MKQNKIFLLLVLFAVSCSSPNNYVGLWVLHNNAEVTMEILIDNTVLFPAFAKSIVSITDSSDNTRNLGTLCILIPRTDDKFLKGQFDPNKKEISVKSHSKVLKFKVEPETNNSIYLENDNNILIFYRMRNKER